MKHHLYLVTGGGPAIDTPDPKQAHDWVTARSLKVQTGPRADLEVVACWRADVVTGNVTVVMIVSDGKVRLDHLGPILPRIKSSPG